MPRVQQEVIANSLERLVGQERLLGRRAMGVVTYAGDFLLTQHSIDAYSVVEVDPSGDPVLSTLKHGTIWKIESCEEGQLFYLGNRDGLLLSVCSVTKLVGSERFFS